MTIIELRTNYPNTYRKYKNDYNSKRMQDSPFIRICSFVERQGYEVLVVPIIFDDESKEKYFPKLKSKNGESLVYKTHITTLKRAKKYALIKALNFEEFSCYD